MATMLAIVNWLRLSTIAFLIVGYVGRMMYLRYRSGREARQDWISQRKEIISKTSLVSLCCFVIVLLSILLIDFSFHAKREDSFAMAELFLAIAGILGGCAGSLVDFKGINDEVKVHATWVFRIALVIGVLSALLYVAHLRLLGDDHAVIIVGIGLFVGASIVLLCKDRWKPMYAAPIFEWIARLGMVQLAFSVALTLVLAIRNLVG